jgi:predicted GIY-YIG superfamily endonuclease
MPGDYWIYILTNFPRRSVLYIGVTNSLEVRLHQHRAGEVRGFAWRNNTFALVYYEHFSQPQMAISREKQLKGWVRRKKEALINAMNPEWRDLAHDLFGDAASDADVAGNARGISTPPLRACAAKAVKRTESMSLVIPRDPSTPFRPPLDRPKLRSG